MIPLRRLNNLNVTDGQLIVVSNYVFLYFVKFHHVEEACDQTVYIAHKSFGR
jgi:hypothetical protein